MCMYIYIYIYIERDVFIHTNRRALGSRRASVRAASAATSEQKPAHGYIMCMYIYIYMYTCIMY